MTPGVAVDLDSTLFDTRGRQHLVEELRDHPDRWLHYAMACELDEPVESIVKLVNILARSHTIVVVSGRHPASKNLTRQMLNKHNVRYNHAILINPTGDMKTVAENKIDAALGWAEIFGVRFDLAIDDSPDVAAEWLKHGVHTILVAPPLLTGVTANC